MPLTDEPHAFRQDGTTPCLPDLIRRVGALR